MKVSYYPGCSLDGTAREYGESTEAVISALGVELEELADWNCCGASSAHATSDRLAVSLPARNLAIADRAGRDVMVPCAACYSRLKVAEKALKNGDSATGVEGYKGDFNIKHLSDFLFDDIGAAQIAAKQVKSLAGLNPVCYYGCLVTRPPQTTGAANADNPESVDEVLAALGAEVKPWAFKTDCCGSGHVLTQTDVALRMIQKLLDMAAEAGADCIVCSCPMCQGNLDSWQSQISAQTGQPYATPIFYVTELVGLAIGHPDTEKWLARHNVDPRPLLRARGLIQGSA
jgi:heterodisulfide reductase subunit B